MTTQALQDHILFQTGYLVNGIWKTLDTTFDVLNPATGEVIAKVAKAGKAQTEEAIAAVTKAFPAWRAKTAKERSAILYRWYELIIENKSWLGQLMTTEQGKPLKEAEGEVEYAASFIQWFAEEAKRANGEIIPPIKPGSRILATREPIGVVAAITPWNFPMAMLTRKLGPALAAGRRQAAHPAPFLLRPVQYGRPGPADRRGRCDGLLFQPQYPSGSGIPAAGTRPETVHRGL